MEMTTETKARKWARNYEMICSRYRAILGFGGLRERVLVGLWTDVDGRRRRVDLVGLGAASSLESAQHLALSGMERTEPGTVEHRLYRDWHRRLKATERAALAADRRYRERVRAHCAGLPEYAPELVAAE
jgi:hypothetical protein